MKSAEPLSITLINLWPDAFIRLIRAKRHAWPFAGGVEDYSGRLELDQYFSTQRPDHCRYPRIPRIGDSPSTCEETILR
jgi:alpha-amylase/alpha-mannosidase (GH57 family)